MHYDKKHGAIYKSIEALDRMGMDIIETGDPDAFKQYLSEYDNTICGRHPISVFLHVSASIFLRSFQMDWWMKLGTIFSGKFFLYSEMFDHLVREFSWFSYIAKSKFSWSLFYFHGFFDCMYLLQLMFYFFHFTATNKFLYFTIYKIHQMLRNCSTKIKIKFLRYEQSSQCKSMRDSSVSYASAAGKVDAWSLIVANLLYIQKFNFFKLAVIFNLITCKNGWLMVLFSLFICLILIMDHPAYWFLSFVALDALS